MLIRSSLYRKLIRDLPQKPLSRKKVGSTDSQPLLRCDRSVDCFAESEDQSRRLADIRHRVTVEIGPP